MQDSQFKELTLCWVCSSNGCNQKFKEYFVWKTFEAQLGRPRMRWKDSTEMVLRAVTRENVNYNELVQDHY
jgi:hypothetical protein